MKVSGFTFIRNAVKYDYPIVECIQSVLPLVDEMIVLVGNSDDETRWLIEQIQSDKIKIHDSVWDESLRKGGRVLADETQKAMNLVSKDADWLIGLQADECLHEEDYEPLKASMTRHLNNPIVDGLLFKYLHFYADYSLLGTGRKWYRNEIRVIRNSSNIYPYRDSQGFRKKPNQKLNVAQSNARVFHYGWVKPPQKQQAKQRYFNSLWHSDEVVEKMVGEKLEYDYNNIDSLTPYRGSHPNVYAKRIATYVPPEGIKSGVFIRNPFKRLLHWVEQSMGLRFGEYKNYHLVE